MKIMLLAGEESGQIYAKRLKALFPQHEVRGYYDYGFLTSDLAVMGYWAVLRRLFFFLNVARTMRRAIDAWKPDVVCTIDYPGMNLKLAAYAKSRGIRTVHVVCPQVWAWKKGRIPKIEASLDRLCCFFPFEPALFRPGFAEFVGHPLVADFEQAVAARRARSGADRGGRLVALLPGSRIGEIRRCLPVMLEALAGLDGVRAAIPAANKGARAEIDAIVRAAGAKDVEVRDGGARELLLEADCAAVASGTATLEAALARCPTVLVYRVTPFLAWFARRVIKEIKHVGLVNVVWEKMRPDSTEFPMPELLQESFTSDAVARQLRIWLDSPSARADAVARLGAAVSLLGDGRGSLERIASILTQFPARGLDLV